MGTCTVLSLSLTHRAFFFLTVGNWRIATIPREDIHFSRPFELFLAEATPTPLTLTPTLTLTLTMGMFKFRCGPLCTRSSHVLQRALSVARHYSRYLGFFLIQGLCRRTYMLERGRVPSSARHRSDSSRSRGVMLFHPWLPGDPSSLDSQPRV